MHRQNLSGPRCNGAHQPQLGSTFVPFDNSDDDADFDEQETPRPSGGGEALVDCLMEARALEKRRITNLSRATSALRNAIGGKATVVNLATIDGRLVCVVDGVLPRELVEGFYRCLQGDAFRRTEFARSDTREFRHHITEYSIEKLRQTQLFACVDSVVRVCVPPSASMEVYRIYTNAVSYGDVAFSHRDSCDDSHITALVYPNPEWASELGGETIFYDEEGNIVEAVSPAPGRLCIFTGSIYHKGSPPSRLFFGTRYTTAFKYCPSEAGK